MRFTFKLYRTWEIGLKEKYVSIHIIMLVHPQHKLRHSLRITKYIYRIISVLPVYNVRSSLKKCRSVLRQTSRRCHTFGLDTHIEMAEFVGNE
jgi:hypothetical protein